MGKKIKIKPTFLTSFIILALTYSVIELLIRTGIISDYFQTTLATICINIILALSLNLITGFTGQFSLGHAGFMAIGAYVCAIITLRAPTYTAFIIGMVAGAVAAAAAGAVVGLPTLRLKGDYLAIATLGMAEIIRIIFTNLKITNGAAGLQGIPQFINWSWLFALTLITYFVLRNFLNSSHGRACISVREDEVAAEAMGINTTKYKVIAFVIGTFFAGIAGAVYASYFYYLKPNIFNFSKSVDILVIVVLGGMGSLSGSVIGAAILAIISTYLQRFPEIRMIIYALILIVIMLLRPQGIMGSKELSLKLFSGITHKKFSTGKRKV
ncbi:MAG: branched-chain amino acid ABC transporter permease [Clostridiaceae bacterium]|nr:branched-chain amino acid ABC transporter permease [Clostridiaceae bacterium]